MACKRVATSELNHENWDNEEEPEEAGNFVRAPREVLEKRVVRSARRRLTRGGDVASSGNVSSPFGLFSGFKTTQAPTSSSPFGFLSKANAPESSSTSSGTTVESNADTKNGGKKKLENGTDSPIPNTNAVVSFPTSDKIAKSDDATKSEITSDKEERISKKSSDYFAKLKGLNESVTQWIKSHVDLNPFCILTPIFRDYERYLKEIEAKESRETDDEIVLEKPLASSSKLSSITEMEKKSSDDAKSVQPKLNFFDSVGKTSVTNASLNWGSKKSSDADAKSSFGTTSENKNDKSIFGGIGTESRFMNKTSSLPQINEDSEKSQSEKSSGYASFGQSTTASATFSFGQSSTTGSAPSAGFSFGSGKPFSFGSHIVAAQAAENKADEEKEEEDDEPPKPDFKPIKEDDAFYEKRCKVFVKKDGNFSDRGVGILFLKSTSNGKTQLIVRGDNSLGSLLLNTLLTESIPTKRMNPKTVMLVCLPMPDSKPPPTPVLLRVKTAEDADNLIETLDNNKK